MNKEIMKKTYKTVTVNGKQVTTVLDTGSFTSLAKKCLVPVGGVDYSRETDILCVHGDNHAYPKAEVTVIIDDQPYLLTVGVVEHLPVDVLLGTDLPVLIDLLQGGESNCGGNVSDRVSCTVIT